MGLSCCEHLGWVRVSIFVTKGVTMNFRRVQWSVVLISMGAIAAPVVIGTAGLSAAGMQGSQQPGNPNPNDPNGPNNPPNNPNGPNPGNNPNKPSRPKDRNGPAPKP